jgi:hypothetical protein
MALYLLIIEQKETLLQPRAYLKLLKGRKIFRRKRIIMKKDFLQLKVLVMRKKLMLISLNSYVLKKSNSKINLRKNNNFSKVFNFNQQIIQLHKPSLYNQ